MAYKPRKDIKVPESYIQKLRDTGSKKAALEKYGKSTDPKMREALRRFYGANAVAPATDSKRAKLGTLPKKSVDIKSKTVSQAKPKPGSNTTQVRSTRGTTAAPTSKAPNRAAANKAAANKAAGNKRAVQIASMVPVVRGAMLGKAAYSAAAKQVGVAKVKQGVKKGIATKSELSEARGMARGMVKDTAKLKSKTAKAKVVTTVKSKTKNATALQRANAMRKASKAGK